MWFVSLVGVVYGVGWPLAPFVVANFYMAVAGLVVTSKELPCRHSTSAWPALPESFVGSMLSVV